MIEPFLNGLSGYVASDHLAAYLAAYLGGLLVSFTPCIYPVIPLVIAFIGAQSDSSRIRGFFLALMYVLGLSITYAFLGGISALTGRLFGTIQNSFWVTLFVANVCILMGLSMLDVFAMQIKLPGLLSQSQIGSGHKGMFGSFLVGLTSGLLVGPCSAPVFSVLLAYAATQQSFFFGMSLLFVFALGMGTLLVVIGAFVGLLASLPRSGLWMVRIKQGCGWLLIAIGEYFLVQAGRSLV